MTITSLLFLGMFSGGIAAGLFVHPRYALYAYFVAFFMSPKSSWWGSYVPDVRYLLIAGIVTLAAILIHGTKSAGYKWTQIGGFKIFLCFVIWLLPLNLWALSPEEQLEGTILFAKHLLIAYAIFRIATELEAIKMICLVAVIGYTWFGWLAYGKTGTRLEGLAGNVADANTLGMYTSTGVMFAAMMFLGFTGKFRWVAFACIPLILNTVILSGSRGAFLGLLSGGLTAAYFCPQRYRGQFGVFAMLGVILFMTLAHEQFLERITTLFHATEGTEQLDRSASSRIDIAKAGWEMAKDHPLGVGTSGTAILSPRYMAADILDHGSRAAHNSIMDALVSYGFVGAILYLLLYYWCGRQLLFLRRLSTFDRNTDLGILAGMFASTLSVVFIAGLFSNYHQAEVQYWVVALIAATLNLPEVRNSTNFALAVRRQRQNRGYQRSLRQPD